VMVAGNGSAMVYARPGEPRSERWPIERLRSPETFGSRGDLIDALVREPAVAFVAGEAAEGGLRLVSEGGTARVWSTGEELVYQPESGDPLQVSDFRRGTPRQWLEATWDSAYPDAVFQLLDQFGSRRTGDLLVIAREGYDFRARYELPEHRWGHGSLIRTHMQTPVWSSQPVPAAPMRTVDLFPGMLNWLGVSVPKAIDGDAHWLPRRATKPRKETMRVVSSAT
jgi:hypothetical protein